MPTSSSLTLALVAGGLLVAVAVTVAVVLALVLRRRSYRWEGFETPEVRLQSLHGGPMTSGELRVYASDGVPLNNMPLHFDANGRATHQGGVPWPPGGLWVVGGTPPDTGLNDPATFHTAALRLPDAAPPAATLGLRLQGWSVVSRGWRKVAAAVDAGASSVELTLSWVPPGVAIQEADGSGSVQSTALAEAGGGLPEAAFRQEVLDGIHAALEALNVALAGTGTRVSLRVLGVEGVSPPPLGQQNTYIGRADVGEIRVAAATGVGVNGVLAFAYPSELSAERSAAADMVFNVAAGIGWHANADPDPREFNVALVAAHEFLHVLGLGHDADAGATMAARVMSTRDTLGDAASALTADASVLQPLTLLYRPAALAVGNSGTVEWPVGPQLVVP